MSNILRTKREIDYTTSRRITLYVYQAVNWVEDAVLNLMDEMEKGEKVAVYFRARYPKDFSRLMNLENEERRTLLKRIKYMLDKFFGLDIREFPEWRYSGLQGTLDVFTGVITRVYGAENAKDIIEWVGMLKEIWHVSGAVETTEQLKERISRLKSKVDGIFSRLYDVVYAAENNEDEAKAKEPTIAEKLDALKSSLDANTKKTDKAVKALEKVTIEKNLEEGKDGSEYSRTAGLENLTSTKRYQIMKAIQYSYAGYKIEKDTKNPEAQTLSKLAAAVWAENLEEFRRLSKLENDPGYRDMVAFRTALYRLVKKYPLAAHFVWE